MSTTSCDSCGKPMAPHSHYVVRIDVFADPAMPATSSDEIAKMDLDAEIARLMEEMKGLSAEELQNQVHQRFEFTICPECRKRFAVNPLGKPRVLGQGEN